MFRFMLLILILFPSVILHGQDFQVKEAAFMDSYTAEADSNYNAAIEALKSVYDSSYPFNLRLGWLHYLNGDYQKSIEYYSSAMRNMPYAVEAKLGYVLPQSAMGNWNEVLSIYQQILKIDPKNTLVNYRMAVIYYERTEYDKAYAHAEISANLFPFDYYSVSLLGWINLKMGNMREARKLFERALLISPGNELAGEGLKEIK